MARAATKKGKRAKQAPHPPKRSGNIGGSAKSVEQELFFGRIRRQAKWVFALLAVVFAGSFVFLGVGSGNAGLGDLFSGDFHLFGGSSGPSVEKLQKKLAENPRSTQAYFDLSDALANDRRTPEAIDVLLRYTRLHPNDLSGWSRLAALYERRARVQEGQLRIAAAKTAPVLDPAEFAPTGLLGQALTSVPDPIVQTLQSQASARQAVLLPQLQETRRGALAAYQRIADLSPDEPGAVEQVGFAALQVCSASSSSACPELRTALLAFQGYVAKFPDATDAAQVKQQIKQIQAQLRATPTVVPPSQS
jgi:tetratricopeptide (TPR) repeat protein